MAREITVLRETNVRQRARELAEKYYEGYHPPKTVMDEVDEVDDYPFSHVSGHGRWDTHILPKLRKIAGCGDVYNKGTYTDEYNEIVYIPAGKEDDIPSSGCIIKAKHILDDVVLEEYKERAYEIMREAVEKEIYRKGSS